MRAYEHAASVVRTLGDGLGELVEQDRLRELQGIGAATSRQISELWRSGTSEYLARLRAEHPEGAAELVQVAGMTPRRIRALAASLGVRSVEGLRDACAAGRVRRVPGFGEKTERRLLEASERWLEPGEAAPRRLILAHALELAAILEHALSNVVEGAHLAGALRRGEETVGELELVVQGDLERALRRLSGLRQVLHSRLYMSSSPRTPAPRCDFERRVA